MRSVDFKYMNLKKAYDRLVEVSNLYDGKNDIIRDSLNEIKIKHIKLMLIKKYVCCK